MKPKDLKYPFSWEERRPLFSDRVFFVPDYYDKHDARAFPPFEPSYPINIEYCTGNGNWIAEKAKNSSTRWIAVEWRFDRVRKIWSKMKNNSLLNLIVICGEAFIFTREYLPSWSIQEAFINFPDPWPKEKHAKNRLFQVPFVHALSRVVQRAVTVATDDLLYLEQIQKVMGCNGLWKSPVYTTNWPDYGASYFDTLWREKGKTIHYLYYERNHPSS